MNTILKRSLQGIVAVAIVSGTYFGRGKDFPPLYSHKTHDAYGINVAGYTKIDSGASINGANFSVYMINKGKINGLNLSIINKNYSRINGANVGAVNYEDNGLINGLELGLGSGSRNGNEVENSSKINGVAIGIVNQHSELNGVQIGFLNWTKNNSGAILNVDYQNKKSEIK